MDNSFIGVYDYDLKIYFIALIGLYFLWLANWLRK